MKKASLLLYADSERSSDMLYLGHFQAPDPFIALQVRGKSIAVVNSLELGRARKESSFDRVLLIDGCQAKALKLWPKRSPGVAEVIAALAAELKEKSFTIPDDFPAALAAQLSRLGIKLTFANGGLFPQRDVKSPAEAAALREGNRCSALGIGAAERLLRASVIRKGRLYYKGELLTSEKLRFAIEVACLEAGALSMGTIAAGGDQACDPHCRGTGPLRANELIILDVFPRVISSGYFGDMTRTFLRGHASDAQRALVETVRSAQLGALRVIRSGVNGRDVHRGVVAEFENRGYRTVRSEKGSSGFFHGLGHGVGLSIHERPRLSAAIDSTLERGSVVTVEPGLYYPGLGGCRIEDVVQVTDSRPKMLSSYPYEWELR
jgi:Xaa-Pro aminopeptidase